MKIEQTPNTEKTNKETDKKQKSFKPKGLIYKYGVINQKKRHGTSLQNLRHFIKEGLWSSICTGLGETNFTSLILAIGGNATHISVLYAIPLFANSVIQLMNEKVIHIFGTRKKFILDVVLLQILLLCTMSFLAFMHASVGWFLAAAVIYIFGTEMNVPAWNAWISDIIPDEKRGFFFSRRSRLIQISNFFAIIAAGLFLDKFVYFAGVSIAFGCLFLSAAIARAISYLHLRTQSNENEKDLGQKHLLLSNIHGPKQMLKDIFLNPSTRGLFLFYGLMSLSINISGPFCAAYALKSLKVSYLELALLLSVVAAGRFLTIRFWGKLVDRVQSRKLLLLASLLMPISPFGWWLFSDFWILMIFQFIAGVAWGGFELCGFTYIAEVTPKNLRSHIYAAKQIAWSILFFIGTFIGGVILEKNIFNIFEISFVFRLATALVFTQVLPNSRK